MTTTGYLLIIVAAIVLNGFFSGMEIAYVSANRLKMEIESKKSKFLLYTLGLFLRNPVRYFTTMLIGSGLILVVYGIFTSILLEPFVEKITSNHWLALTVQTVISTIVILVIGEFLAKILFRINPNKILKTFATPTIFFYIIFYPVNIFTTFISNMFLRIFTGKKAVGNVEYHVFDRYDLSDLVSLQQAQQNQQESLATRRNAEMFQNVLDFQDITARECIVPRNELEAIEINEQLDKLILMFAKTGFSRILVYENNIDNIVGFIHTSDMFNHPASLKNLVRPIDIVPESMPANKLLKTFIKKHKTMALVVDEFGGTSGIVTLEDILEEIVGEIEDEHDVNEYDETVLGANKYLFSGRLEIDYLNEKYELDMDKNEHYETLAGFIIYNCRNIPKTNQTITVKNFQFKIVKATNTQIVTVEITVNPA